MEIICSNFFPEFSKNSIGSMKRLMFRYGSYYFLSKYFWAGNGRILITIDPNLVPDYSIIEKIAFAFSTACSKELHHKSINISIMVDVIRTSEINNNAKAHKYLKQYKSILAYYSNTTGIKFELIFEQDLFKLVSNKFLKNKINKFYFDSLKKLENNSDFQSLIRLAYCYHINCLTDYNYSIVELTDSSIDYKGCIEKLLNNRDIDLSISKCFKEIFSETFVISIDNIEFQKKNLIFSEIMNDRNDKLTFDKIFKSYGFASLSKILVNVSLTGFTSEISYI